MDGGPIALARDGDRIVLDTADGAIDIDVDNAELTRRAKAWNPLPLRYTRGVLAKYTKLVGSGVGGAVCE